MVGLKWKRTVVAACAWAGLAWGQSTPTPSSPTLEKPRILTVQELGRGPQRCRVLRTWREADGMVVFEVQSISTGERMTIVESSPISARAGSQPGSKLETMTTRIYHWNGATPPAGAPLPPKNALVLAPAATPASPTIVNPSTAPRSNWPAANSMTLPAKPEQPAPVAADITSKPVMPPPAPTPAPVQVAQVTSDPVKPQTSQPQKPDRSKVESAQPSDWHKSWGKPNYTKPVPVTELPHADTSRPDPLRDPQTYSRPAPDEKTADAAAAPKPVPQLPTPAAVVQAPPQKPAAPPPLPTVAAAPTPPPMQAAPAKPAPAVVAAAPAKPAETKLTPVPVTASGPCTTSTPCNAPCVVCGESPKRWFQFWKASPCKECKQDCCICQPASKAGAPCPCEPCAPVCSVKEKPPVAAAPAPVPPKPAPAPAPAVVRQPAPQTPTFAEKFQAALAQSREQRQARAQQSVQTTTVVPDNPPMPAPKPGEVALGAKSVAAAGDGALMPVPVIMMPPVRNQQAQRLPKPAPVQEAQPALPRSEIENAFTEIEPAGGKKNKAKAQPQVDDENANAFTTPPDQEGEFPQRMNVAMQQYAGMNPGYGYAPSGMGRFPYGFNSAMPYAQRPPMGMMMPRPPMAMGQPPMMMPGPVYINDPPARPAGTEAASAERSASQPNIDIPHLLTLLKSALYPSHREWAADGLARLDWRQNPQVVEALVKAAREDPAATVRTGCVRGLGTMNANTPVVVAALHTVQSDTAPQVAQEATRVLGQFSGMNLSKK